MRKFEKEVETKRGVQKKPIGGLVLVHIGGEVWRVGHMRWVPGKGKHRVIYGPNDKEYHVWGEDTKFGTNAHPWFEERFMDKTDPAEVKIYILTSILDKREHWTFDLQCKPEIGKIIKVIYNNGTVMNHKYDGGFHDEVIKPKRFHVVERTITPVAWRYF